MHYFGGKSRIAKRLAQYMTIHREFDTYFEPFVGGLNVIQYMRGRRIANDINPYIIELYKAVQNGYEPPSNVSEDEYYRIKAGEDIKLIGFVGHACSFGGKWWGGYARDGRGTNYASAGRNSLLKKNIDGVEFHSQDYKLFEPKEMIIYCDPPYASTYKGWGGTVFDTNEFWNVMRKWSVNNQVFISEYVAPDDFKCVLGIETNIEIRSKNGREERVERLFTIE